MQGSYSKKTYIISYPDRTGGTEFFNRDKFDVDIRKVDDHTFKVDVDFPKETIDEKTVRLLKERGEKPLIDASK